MHPAPTETPEAPAGPTTAPDLRVRRIRPPMCVAISVIGLAVLAAAFAPLISPHSPTGGSVIDQLLPMSGNHPLGTDTNGNDILSRILHGARPSLLGPLAVVLLSVLVGVPLAITSAWKGGIVDRIIGRSLDLVFCFPPMLIAAILVIMFGRGLMPAVVAVAIAYVPWMARITRTTCIRERNKPYIVACEVQGLSGPTIAVRHLLPNVGRIIVAQATTSFGFALIDLAALSFVGLGIIPPSPDWGIMLADTTGIVQGNYNGPLAAAACIVLVVGAFTYIGNQLSDYREEN